MNATLSPLLKSLMLALVVAGALAVDSGPADAACLSQRQARDAVASGKAMRLGAIARAVGGDIVNAELCERGGGLVYRLAVMGEGGRVVNMVVDARSGAIQR